jgi:hypothetical protein
VPLAMIDLDSFSIRARWPPCIPQGLEQVPPFHAHDAFYTLSACEFSNGRHSFAGHFTCALRLIFDMRKHVNRFAHSLHPRHPPHRNLFEGDYTLVTPSYPTDGKLSDATRGSPTVLL